MENSFQEGFARVLIVDDDGSHRFALEHALRQMHRPEIESFLAKSLQHVTEILENQDIDVCFCDFQLWDGATALDVLRSAQQRGHRVPFVAITGLVDEDSFAHELLVAGFDDVLHKDELRNANLYRIIRNSWLRNLRSREVEQNALKDPLTGLHNRRSLEARLQLECDRVGREIAHLAVTFLDLDGFKKINDDHGHAAGDECLKHVAETLQKSVRKTDFVARIGGDEFVVLLPNCPANMAAIVSKKLQKNVEEAQVSFNGVTLHCSTSAGTVMYDPVTGLDSPTALLQASDSAMYQDKREKKKAVSRAPD